MEQERNMLNEYIEILNKEEQDMTAGDYQTIYSVENNDKLRDIVKSIHSTSSTSDRYQMVYNFIEQEQYNQMSEKEKMKEALKKEFGIDLKNIDHMKLQSGIDIIAFYDTNLNRKRLIDYSYAKSLTEEFTNIQNKNTNFQTDNNDENSLLIAKQEANKNNKKELDMIDINRAKNEYQDLVVRIKDQDPTKVQSINELLKEAEKRNIKFINFENMVALDEKGNIIESFYNEKTEQYELETPEKIDSSVDVVENKEEIKQEYQEPDNSTQDEPEEETKEEENNPTEFEMEEELKDAEFEKMLTESMEIYHINCDKEQFYNNIVKYSSNMDLLEEDLMKNQITQEEYECYKMCCEKYISIKSKKMENTKTLVLEKGFITSIIISILTIIIGIIVFIMSL